MHLARNPGRGVDNSCVARGNRLACPLINCSTCLQLALNADWKAGCAVLPRAAFCPGAFTAPHETVPLTTSVHTAAPSLVPGGSAGLGYQQYSHVAALSNLMQLATARFEARRSIGNLHSRARLSPTLASQSTQDAIHCMPRAYALLLLCAHEQRHAQLPSYGFQVPFRPQDFQHICPPTHLRSSPLPPCLGGAAPASPSLQAGPSYSAFPTDQQMPHSASRHVSGLPIS